MVCPLPGTITDRSRKYRPLIDRTEIPSERPYIGQQQAAGLALFFGAIVVFGPTIFNFLRFQMPTVDPTKPDDSYEIKEPQGRLVYVASRTPGAAPPAAPTVKPQLQGYVFTFLVSSALTLGALLGQLGVAGFLIYQIDTVMTGLGQALLIGAIMVIGFLALIYAGYMVYSAVKDKKKRRASLKENHPDLFSDHYTREQSQVTL
jgi:hypothetical protein